MAGFVYSVQKLLVIFALLISENLNQVHMNSTQTLVLNDIYWYLVDSYLGYFEKRQKKVLHK